MCENYKVNLTKTNDEIKNSKKSVKIMIDDLNNKMQHYNLKIELLKSQINELNNTISIQNP